MLRLFGRRDIDADQVVGNVVLGDVSGTLIQNFQAGGPNQEPVLPWRPLPDDRDIFKLLHWRSRLAPDLIGRGAEREQLLAWAKADHWPRARFLIGPGGAGKTRLAAEVAERLRQEGWTAGFARLDQSVVLPVRQGGILLIVDYPEERREQNRALLADLAALGEAAPPVRVLLLSRRDVDWWQEDIDAAHAGDVCDAQAIELRPLADIDVRRLLRAAAERLANHLGENVPGWTDGAIDAWRERDPRLHTLPLFAMAAAVHGVLEPDNPLGIGGADVVQALVRRERLRLTNISRALGLEEPTAARLLGLAAAAGSLNAEAVRRLAEPALELGLPPPERALNRVRQLPWWEDHCLPMPTPDLVAAALLLQVLAERPDQAPEWLWAALQDSGPDLADRLGRLSYDVATVYGLGEERLPNWLAAMIDQDATRAMQMEFLTAPAYLPSGALPLAISVCRALLREDTEDERARSRRLVNLSNHLHQAGDGLGALQAIEDAVGIGERLAHANPARYEPDLARSLNNLSNRLGDTGDEPGAFQAIQESVAIRRRLAEANPARYEPDLARSLNNLSNRLSNAGDGPGALQAIQESVAIRRRLAQGDPTQYEPDLAGSLSNLSNVLSDAGDHPGALETIREASGIYQRLAEANPARYESDLAGILNNLSNRLSDAGDWPRGLAAIRDSVGIWRRLAEANPARYEPGLAQSLNTLSNRLTDAGHQPGGLAAIRASVGIWRRLAEANPARHEPDLALSLNNLSNLLSAARDEPGALQAIQEAVVIRRRLAEANPARYEPDLARSLNNLAKRLSNAGDEEGARQALEEAEKICRRRPG